MSTAPPLIALRGVELSLGATPLFLGVDLALTRGERVALVGRNGAGKSTLMRILTGSLEPDKGDAFRQPGVRVATLAQEPDLSGHATLLSYASADEGVADWQAEAALMEQGLDPALDPMTLSGGQGRRAALARVLATDPDVLLLDEPTNHLDIPAIEALEATLKAFRGAVLVVSHDRRFLEAISTACLWLRQGKVRRFSGGYAGFDTWAEEIENREQADFDRLETHLKAEARWLARGVTARRKRNMGRMRKVADMRAERRERKTLLNDASARATLETSSAGSVSRMVFEAKGLTKSFDTPDGPKPIVKGLDLRVMHGDRLGLIGPNGSGKTTLLKLLLGDLAADSGSLRQGRTLEVTYLDQSRASLDPEATLWDTLCPLGGDQVIVNGHARHVAGYAQDFLFTPAQLRQPVRALSGGERNRLTLALAFARPASVLVLDEPTNDLDMDTLDLLEEAISDFDGTVILVSHDRAFLDALVTSTLAPMGDGRWIETPGGYADWERQTRPLIVQPLTQAPQTARPAAKAPPPAPAQPTKGGLTSKEQRRLAELEKLMARLGELITGLEADLADPGLYARDASLFATRSTALTQARTALDTAEAEWLMLEERRG